MVRNASCWWWGWLGVLLVGIGIVFCEWREPFFFTRDDNFSSALPQYLQICRSAFAGVFCTWNPYQIMGLPTASNVGIPVAYPPLYLAYAIARYLLGNEFNLIEVFNILHYLAGALCCYYLARLLGIRPLIAVAGSMALMLSGFFLGMGNSWSSVATTSLWIIPLLIGIVQLTRETGVLALGVVGYGAGYCAGKFCRSSGTLAV